jgi:hypothetical protein
MDEDSIAITTRGACIVESEKKWLAVAVASAPITILEDGSCVQMSERLL